MAATVRSRRIVVVASHTNATIQSADRAPSTTVQATPREVAGVLEQRSREYLLQAFNAQQRRNLERPKLRRAAPMSRLLALWTSGHVGDC